MHSQKRNSICKGSEAREDTVHSENIGTKGEGEQGARCGVNGKGLALLFGTKGGVAVWHLPERTSTGGHGTPSP